MDQEIFDQLVALTEVAYSLNIYLRALLVIIGIFIAFGGAWMVWVFLRRILNQWVFRSFNL